MGPSSRRGVVVVALAVAVAVSSCSSTGESHTSTVPPPVDSVQLGATDGPVATFGTPAAVGELRVTASDPVIGSDESGPWLTLTVRAENRSQADTQAPQFQLRCSGSAAGGAWLTTSTFKQDQSVPAGSVNEGTLSLLLPGDERGDKPRPSCAKPATVVASHLTFDNNGAGAPVEKRVTWSVPDDLVDQMNAAPPAP